MLMLGLLLSVVAASHLQVPKSDQGHEDVGQETFWEREHPLLMPIGLMMERMFGPFPGDYSKVCLRVAGTAEKVPTAIFTLYSSYYSNVLI